MRKGVVFLVALSFLLFYPIGKGNDVSEWPPQHEKVAFLPVVSVVESNNSYAFLCSIPMAVFHHNNTSYQSMLITEDIDEMPVQYIMEDWKEYLAPWGGVKRINFIGNISYTKKLQIKNFYNLGWENITNVTGNEIEIANQIAIKGWKFSDIAVIAPYILNPQNEDIESISNAAVLSALYNSPLLLSHPSSISTDTINVLKDLKVQQVILVEIGNKLNDSINSQLAAEGISIIDDLLTENMVVSKIRNITNRSMLCAIIKDEQSLPASLYGARYGGYVLYLPADILTIANYVYEEIQNLDMPDRKLEEFEMPTYIRYGEEQIANNFYTWLESIGGNDTDDLEIVVTFNTAPYYDPTNGFAVTFERAISGDPSNLANKGAIPSRMPLDYIGNIALVNRGGMYRAVIFANPRPYHVTLCMNAYEVQHIVDAGWPTVDSWGTNHIVNEIFGWPYRGWCSQNNYFPWQDIHNNTPNLSPILPPGNGDGADCDPGVFATFLGRGYEVHFHSGAYPGTGSHPSQPDVPNIGFVADVENGSTFLYFSCHGGGTYIAVREYDNGIAQDYNGEAWGSPYWPDDDGRTYDGSAGGDYSQYDMDNDFGNTHSLIIGYNACGMANGMMNEILLKHGGLMSIGSYTSVSFTGSGWWWNLFTYLITFENYSLGEAATYATARTSPIYVGESYRGVDSTLHYVCYGDPMVKFVKIEWTSPEPSSIDVLYGGHCIGNYTEPNVTILLNLTEGWNIITIPCKNNLTASMLYFSIPYCSIILKWNVSIQNFDVYVPSSPYDFAIEDGIGYFIAVTNNSNLSIEGKRIYEVNITLYEGWNCLGWINEEPIKASSLYENISYCNILLKWNTSKQNFDIYVPSSPYDFTIKQGEGFMVAVTQQTWLVLK